MNIIKDQLLTEVIALSRIRKGKEIESNSINTNRNWNYN